MATFEYRAFMDDANALTRMRAMCAAVLEENVEQAYMWTPDRLRFLLDHGALPDCRAYVHVLTEHGKTPTDSRRAYERFVRLNSALVSWYDWESAWTHVDWRSLRRMGESYSETDISDLVRMGLWSPVGDSDLNWIRPNFWQWTMRASAALSSRTHDDFNAWSQELSDISR